MSPVAILNYHAIGSTSSPAFQPWTIDRDAFAEQLDLLQQRGLRGVSMRELLAEPADDLVGITFDDGYRDFAEHAVPELAARGFGATVFVATGHIGATSAWLRPDPEGERPMMSWDDVRAVDDAGFEVGSHSVSHPQLDLLPLDQARHEIETSRARIEDELGHPVAGFCYPHGFHGGGVRQATVDAGYDYACAVKHKMSSLDDDRHALSRIVVTAEADPADLDRHLDGSGLRRTPRWLEHLLAAGFRRVRSRTRR